MRRESRLRKSKDSIPGDVELSGLGVVVDVVNYLSHLGMVVRAGTTLAVCPCVRLGERRFDIDVMVSSTVVMVQDCRWSHAGIIHVVVAIVVAFIIEGKLIAFPENKLID